VGASYFRRVSNACRVSAVSGGDAYETRWPCQPVDVQCVGEIAELYKKMKYLYNINISFLIHT